jgi:hypothetical protein
MPENREPIRLAGHSLAEIARLAAERRLPPVASWNPFHCGHSDMRIARDGTWYHQGKPIRREAMVRLFSTILRCEADGSHVLVTPAEKLTIDVELAPFVVTAMTSEGSGEQRRIAFELNSGDPVLLGRGHPLRLQGEIPLLGVRDGLEASLARPVYYELAELALNEGGGPPGVWSNGCFFPLQPT